MVYNFVGELQRQCTCDKNATSSHTEVETTPSGNLKPTITRISSSSREVNNRKNSDYLRISLEDTLKDTGSSCSVPQRHFAMIKIEKTGSSTLYTILGRYVRENNLNMISQLYGVHINFRAPRGKGKDRTQCDTFSNRL